jgi:hypothetical protein
MNKLILIAKIKKQLLRNYLKKADSWAIIITIGLIVYLIMNSIQGSYWFNYFLDHLNENYDTEFITIFKFSLFLLFIFNILTPFFWSGLNQKINVTNILFYYPFKDSQIVFYSIISEIFDIFILIFIPFYFALYFITNNSFLSIKFLYLILIFLLYFYLIGAVLLLLKNIIKIIINKRTFRIILFLIVISTCFFTLLVAIPIKHIDFHFLAKFTYLIDYSPSGILADFMLQNRTNILYRSLFSIICYFLIADVLLFFVNIFLTKFNKRFPYFIRKNKLGMKNYSLKTKIFDILKIRGFIRKDFIYFYRSPSTV